MVIDNEIAWFELDVSGPQSETGITSRTVESDSGETTGVGRNNSEATRDGLQMKRPLKRNVSASNPANQDRIPSALSCG